VQSSFYVHIPFAWQKGLIDFVFFWVIENAGGVLDMFAVDHIGIPSRDNICHLCISWIVCRSLLMRFDI
jgi:hypothetical protein